MTIKRRAFLRAGLLIACCAVFAVSGCTTGASPNNAVLAAITPVPAAESQQARNLATADPTPSSTTKVTATPTAKPTLKPTPKPTPKPTAKPTQKPTPKPATGVFGNPWGYDFRAGYFITNPPGSFCSYFPCIPSFWESTNGYVVQCADGDFSHSGGRRGVCSYHGGFSRALFRH